MRAKFFTLFITLCTCGTFISSCNKEETRPNILFLMLDTLRADHMSGYGYERQTTPVLDQFAKENLKAAFAITAAPWTPASVASMFTGLYPTAHRMMPPNDRMLAKKGLTKLSESLHTLPEILKQNGYRTAGVSPNPWITEQFGYTQGFDQFHFIERQPANKITESGREIITAWRNPQQKGTRGPKSLGPDSDPKSPFFLYLHFLDPHDPYEPPPGYETKFTGPLKNSPFSYSNEQLSNLNLYDGEINFLDTELGKFFDYLKHEGLYDNLVIIVVSDHGEQFMEHGDERHGYKLYNEEVHIPLIIKTGRQSDVGRVVSETVSTVDIMPTILDRLKISKPDGSTPLVGVSLLNETAVKERRGIMSEVRRVYDMKSVTDMPGNRLIMEVPYDMHNPDPARSLESWVAPHTVGLFKAREDYACTKPVQNRGLEAKLSGVFSTLHTDALKILVTPNKPGAEIKDETLEQLKSLGYLQ